MTTTPAHRSAATRLSASALPARQPGMHRPAVPRPAQPLGYDLDRTWDLLAETDELPATQRGLIKVLVEYRKALHALATQLEAIQRGQQPDQSDTPPRAGASHQRTDHPPSRLP